MLALFDEAETITGIGGDMPLQTFAIQRLLEAVLYGFLRQVAGGDSEWTSRWRSLWDDGRHYYPALRKYLEHYRGRFNLFDVEQPFYQVADLRTVNGKTSGLQKLILDVPNGAPFFTTRSGEGLTSLHADEAARWLVTLQAFDPSGIKSGAVGDSRVKSGKGYPIGTAWAGGIGGVSVEGENLWRTLLLNLVGPEVSEGVDWRDDKPIWERSVVGAMPVEGFNQEKESVGVPRYFHGPATLCTWQSRRVHLIHEGSTVTGVIIANGDRLKPQNAHLFEPMTAWRRSPSQEKALHMGSVYMPRRHDPSRALWRGIAVFLPIKNYLETASYKPPLNVQWLNLLQNHGALPENVLVRLHAFGVEYGSNESVVDAVVDDSINIRLAVLASDDPVLAARLNDAIELAGKAVSGLCRLAGGLADLNGRAEDGARRQANELAYNRLDHEFRSWIVDIEDLRGFDERFNEWKRRIRMIFGRLGDSIMQSASTKALIGKTDASGVVHSAGELDYRYRGTINWLTLIPGANPEKGQKAMSSQEGEEQE